MSGSEVSDSIESRVAPWLDTGEALACLREVGVDVRGIRHRYRRCRPDGSAILSFSLLGGEESEDQESLAYVRFFGSASRQSEVEQKWASLRVRDTVHGSGIRRLPGGEGLLVLFPNDLHLRRLNDLTDVDKLKRLAGRLDWFRDRGLRIRGRRSQVNLVRYKPEHRCVARLSLGVRAESGGGASSMAAYARYFADGRAARIVDLLQSLRATKVDWVPEPLGLLLDDRAYIETEVSGDALGEDLSGLEALCSGKGAAIGSAIGERLATLHAVPASSIAGISSGPPWHERVAAACNSLAVVGALARTDVLEIKKQLLAARAGADLRSVVHGDMHLFQWILTARGPALVDFERCSAGDPQEDLGNLLAHVRSLTDLSDSTELTAMGSGVLESYGNRAGGYDERALSAYVALAHLERAVMPHRRLQAGARAESDRQVALAVQSLDEMSLEGSGTVGAMGRTAVRMPLAALDAEQRPWVALYPWSRGPWTVTFEGGAAETRFGRFDVESTRYVLARPEDDPKLVSVRDALREAQIVGYRVGRRLVTRARDERGVTVYRKCLGESKAVRTAVRHQYLEETLGPSGPRIANLVKQSRGLLEFGELPGVTLCEGMRAAGVAQQSDMLSRVARCLVDFQAVIPAEGVFDAQPEAAFQDVVRWSTWIASVAPFELTAYEQCRSFLERRRPQDEGVTALVLSHGDLHDKNVVMCEDAHVGFLDLDGVALRDPATDPGNLVAHLFLRALQQGRDLGSARHGVDAFLTSYLHAGGRADERRVLLHASAAALRLACVYRLRRRWIPLVPSLLSLARELTEGVQ